MDFLSTTPELNYMTQINIMMFEDPSKVWCSDVHTGHDACSLVMVHVFKIFYTTEIYCVSKLFLGFVCTFMTVLSNI